MGVLIFLAEKEQEKEQDTHFPAGRRLRNMGVLIFFHPDFFPRLRNMGVLIFIRNMGVLIFPYETWVS